MTCPANGPLHVTLLDMGAATHIAALHAPQRQSVYPVVSRDHMDVALMTRQPGQVRDRGGAGSRLLGSVGQHSSSSVCMCVPMMQCCQLTCTSVGVLTVVERELVVPPASALYAGSDHTSCALSGCTWWSGYVGWAAEPDDSDWLPTSTQPTATGVRGMHALLLCTTHPCAWKHPTSATSNLSMCPCLHVMPAGPDAL